MSACGKPIEVDEAAEVLRQIASGYLSLAPIVREQGKPATFRAGPYTLQLFDDAASLDCLEYLKHDDGRLGMVDGWCAEVGHAPFELLSGTEQRQLLLIAKALLRQD